MSRVLIIGEYGELAFDLRLHLNLEHEVNHTTRLERSSLLYLNLEDTESFSTLRVDNLDFIVLSAGITGEWKCSREPERSQLVNVTNTIQLLKVLSKMAKRVYFISSSLCFVDGDENDYSENLYVKQKQIVENFILDCCDNVFIVRPSKVIGSQNRRFNEWIGNTKTESVIRVPSNLYSAPISTYLLAIAIENHFSRSDSRILHVSSATLVTYSKIAIELVRKLKMYTKFEEVFLTSRFLGDSEGFIQKASSDLISIGLIPESLDQVLDRYLALRWRLK